MNYEAPNHLQNIKTYFFFSEMSINASSPTSYRERWRYPPTVRRRAGLPKCVLLTSAIFVLGFCGIMLLLRSLAKDLTENECEKRFDKAVPEYERLSSDECQKVCTTQDCLRTASDMISRMDTTVDPCTNFYSFSCGKYSSKVSMEKIRREQFMSDAAEGIKNVIIGIIQNIPKHLERNVPGYSASKLRNLFDSCMNFRSTEEMALPATLKYLEYFGIKNWPHLNSDYQFTNPDLNEVIVRLTFYEVNAFFRFDMPERRENAFATNNTESNSSDVVTKIKAESGRNSLFLSPVSEKEELTLSMSDILNYFGMSDEMINAALVEVFAFDEALNDIIQKSRDRITACTFNASLSCTSYQFDCSNERNLEMEMWCTAAEKVMDAVGIRKKYPRFSIVLVDKFYFEDVKALIDRTSHRTIAHGLALKTVLRNLLLMNYRFRRMDDTSYFLKELIAKFQEDRPLLCFIWVLGHLPALVGASFYSRKYSGQIQKEGTEIYEDIQKYLISLTRNMTWMDREAQDTLEELLRRVRITLHDYLPYISNAAELDEFYKELQITDESFLSNMMELRRFRVVSDLLHHDDHIMLRARQRPKFEFNPNYQVEIIDMDFSSFIYPLLAKDRPRYSNLGFFGSFVAHELSHAVEVFLRDRKNMSSSFEKTLREKKKCLIDQYSEYEIDLINEKVNGSLTLNENMADYFSVRPAYQAVRKYQEEHGTEKRLPGLDFNVEQLFFISFAQWWCENNTPETMRVYLKDNHSPGKYRVLGIMKNFEPFSEAFNCPLGSPMNPAEKCSF